MRPYKWKMNLLKCIGKVEIVGYKTLSWTNSRSEEMKISIKYVCELVVLLNALTMEEFKLKVKNMFVTAPIMYTQRIIPFMHLFKTFVYRR